MANLEDVQLFLQGVDAWNASAKDLEKKNEPAPHKPYRYGRNLSGATIGFLLNRRVVTEEDFFLEQATSYPRADLSFCDLRGTDFTIMGGFDFRSAIFAHSNLQEARLQDAELTGANFVDTNLENANLDGADLTHARLENANLSGADLTGTRPWHANLFEMDLPHRQVFQSIHKSIKSVADLISLCSALYNKCQQSHGELKLYYRGEARKWKLRPSVMRNRYYRNAEGQALLELMTRHPREFGDMDSAISQWVLAQHHGLRTRLLDVTKNPLVALFNVCETKLNSHFAQDDGHLQIFGVPSSVVKPYYSDTVSVIANFAKLSYSEQTLLLGKRRQTNHKYGDVLRKLYHLIGEEKPHFLRRIDPRDFYRVFIVEPQKSFERLKLQSGAFLLSAFHERFERNCVLKWNRNIPVYDQLTVTVPAYCKPHLLSELKTLNITRETLFPSLEASAESINNEFESTHITNSNVKPWKTDRIVINLERRELPPDPWRSK